MRRYIDLAIDLIWFNRDRNVRTPTGVWRRSNILIHSFIHIHLLK